MESGCFEALLRKNSEQQRQAKLLDDLETAKKQKSTNDEIELLRRETQEQIERRQILALQIERASIEQENQRLEKELRSITTRSAQSELLAPSNPKRTHSNSDVKFMPTGKNRLLKFKAPQEFSGEEPDPVSLKNSTLGTTDETRYAEHSIEDLAQDSTYSSLNTNAVPALGIILTSFSTDKEMIETRAKSNVVKLFYVTKLGRLSEITRAQATGINFDGSKIQLYGFHRIECRHRGF